MSINDDNISNESYSIEELEDNKEKQNTLNHNQPNHQEEKGTQQAGVFIQIPSTELNIQPYQENNQNASNPLTDLNPSDDILNEFHSNLPIGHQRGIPMEPYQDDPFQKKDLFRLSNPGNTTINKNSIHVRNPVPPSKLQLVESKYYKLKAELDSFLSSCSNPDESTHSISKQNKEMIAYFDQLNSLLTLIIDSTKLTKPKEPPKQRKTPPQEAQVIVNTNNAKLIEVYKKEHQRLEARLKQVSEPDYQLKLEEELNELDSALQLVEAENKQLQQEQKKNEALIDKQSKSQSSTTRDLKRITMDLEAIQRQHQLTLSKIDKKKISIADNEIKINQLKELKDSLERNALELYNITEYDNVKAEEKNEKRLQEKRSHLKRKIEVLERVQASNKKKYEMEIAKNEKMLFQLRNDKKDLSGRLKAMEAQMVQVKPFSQREVQQEVRKEALKEAEVNHKEPKLISEQLSQNTSGVIIKKKITKPKFDFKSIKSNGVLNGTANERSALIEERQLTEYEKAESKEIKENIIVSNREEGVPLPVEDEVKLLNDKKLIANEDNGPLNQEKEDSYLNDKEENGIEIEIKGVPEFLADLVDDEEGKAEKEKSAEEPKPTLERKTKTEVIQKEMMPPIKSNEFNLKPNENPLQLKSHNEFDQLEEYYI